MATLAYCTNAPTLIYGNCTHQHNRKFILLFPTFSYKFDNGSIKLPWPHAFVTMFGPFLFQECTFCHIYISILNQWKHVNNSIYSCTVTNDTKFKYASYFTWLVNTKMTVGIFRHERQWSNYLTKNTMATNDWQRKKQRQHEPCKFTLNEPGRLRSVNVYTLLGLGIPYVCRREVR